MCVTLFYLNQYRCFYSIRFLEDSISALKKVNRDYVAENGEELFLRFDEGPNVGNFIWLRNPDDRRIVLEDKIYPDTEVSFWAGMVDNLPSQRTKMLN